MLPCFRLKFLQRLYVSLAFITLMTVYYLSLKTFNLVVEMNERPLTNNVTLKIPDDLVLHQNILSFTQNTQYIQNRESTENTQRTESTQRNSKRRGLIIVAHGRSGSSFTLDVFNMNALVFAGYEPLVLAEWWEKKDKNKIGNYVQARLDIITAFMTCSFSKYPYARQFLKEHSVEWKPRLVSRVFNSYPFCNVTKRQETCSELDPEVVDQECLKREYSVVKVMYKRLPGYNISILPLVVEMNRGNVDVSIIHLLRDPRGNINSRIRQGWIHEYPSPLLAGEAKEFCSLLEDNLLVARNFSTSVKERYRVYRYEDLITKPLETAWEMYGFAGFRMTKELQDWLKKSVRPSTIDKWKNEAPRGRTEVIERECKDLMGYMGLSNYALGNQTMETTEITLTELTEIESIQVNPF